MVFKNEADFEEAVIKSLTTKGWEKDILKNYNEKDLIKNWADILYENNRGIDRLNEYPLTDGEMQQIIEQIVTLKTPLRLNSFINGKTVSVKRDNPDDKLHYGKEISLKIYDRREIAAGQSRYQIVQQPKFETRSKVLGDRRGDLMLLINGMPVFHIELKKSGIPVSQAYHQIEKYSRSGVFSGLFSLVQIFVAMNPQETVYFANPGEEGTFNADYYFHWGDFNNEPINDWEKVTDTLLSIPMAHKMIGFYTVADDSDGILKVMRSYQYYAANAISDKVAKTKWDMGNQRGGYIWHTTGSGKTMTSFKSAQLIANSNDADKVVFLTDRIELGIQSFSEYSAFADETDSVQSTENTHMLITTLKSKDIKDTLIVTSIQKMSNIKEEGGLASYDIEVINQKRLVFIVDEAHRSTFGDMLITIKETFPNAIFFGFTGTPIHKENQKKDSTTATIFGDELHRYSIADGIRDENVLGFDPYKILTFKDKEVREKVALYNAKAETVKEAVEDPKKAKMFYKFMDSSQVGMAGSKDENGKYQKGIEDYIPKSQYLTTEHTTQVVKDIKENWDHLSRASKFHAIFATSSIPEAINYYRLIKKEIPTLKVAGLFDPSIDNDEKAVFKEEGLEELIDDYNRMYEKDFTIATYPILKKDIRARLAHKDSYKAIEKTPEKQIDLLIVVNQMLTGFDSKWINTLYLDKVLKYADVIQAFSRTNRIFGEEKPFGTVRYYRYPNTMAKNVEEAVKSYSGDKPIGLFVDKLKDNIEKANLTFLQIEKLFIESKFSNFESLPKEIASKAKFALLFKELFEYIEAMRIQGFSWNKLEYSFKEEFEEEGVATKGYGLGETIELLFDENTFLILAQRYKELRGKTTGEVGGEDVPYDLAGHLTEIDTEKIDTNYMNNRFEKYYKLLKQEGSLAETVEEALKELYTTFATLNQEEQKYAELFLRDIQRGDYIEIEPGATLRDYIVEYQDNARNDRVHKFACKLGIDEEKLREMMELRLTEVNINEFGRFDELMETRKLEISKQFFDEVEEQPVSLPRVIIKSHNLIRKFILEGGFDL